MSNRLANEIAPSIATLEELAPLADYSLMDTLNCDPDGQEDGVDHAPRQVFTGHYVPVNTKPGRACESLTRNLEDYTVPLGPGRPRLALGTGGRHDQSPM